MPGDRSKRRGGTTRFLQEEGRDEQAEELLFGAVGEDLTDEDALCQLIVLLMEQGRRQEALGLYQYSVDVMCEEEGEPTTYTCELAQRIQPGLVLRERGSGYTVVIAKTARPVDVSAWTEDGKDSKNLSAVLRVRVILVCSLSYSR